MGPPMGHVWTDLFEFLGGKYLVCVDKCSGYPLFHKFSSTTSSSVIKVLTFWVGHVLFVPTEVPSSGGNLLRFVPSFK